MSANPVRGDIVYFPVDSTPARSEENRYDGLVRSLRAIGSDLRSIPAETEAEFLSVGSRLQGYYETTLKVSDFSSAATEALTGQKIKDTTKGLDALLGRMAAYVKDSEGSTLKRINKLKDILGAVHVVQKQLDEYAGMSKTLRQLGTTAMVYSAPMAKEGEGFMLLAKNIRDLSESIKSRALAAGDDIKDILHRVTEALEKVGALKEGQYGRAHSALASIRQNLGSLQGRHESASEAFAVIAEWSQDVSRNIGNVVMSSQFQDITRQKFEQVGRSIDELCEKLTGGGARSHGGGLDENDIGIFCDRQANDLFTAKDKLTGAVAGILDSLQDMVASMHEMSAHTHEMVDSGDATGFSFLEDMGGSLASVKSTLSEIFEADMGVSRAIASAGNAVRNITSVVAEIEDIEDQIDIIALNAAVQSAQAGRTGSAMGVLAKNIRQVSSASVEMTSKTAEALRSLAEDVEGLLSEVNEELTVTLDEANRMETEMSGLIDSLERLNKHISSVLKEMDEEVRSLSGDIARTVQETNAHNKAGRILDGVISGLRGIAGERGKLIAPGANYFAENGRRESVVLTSISGAAVDSKDETFGGNVEFF